jgi:hypothetical protein
MRVLMDFNAETVDGRFFARTSRLEPPVQPGQLVQAYDEDDNQLVMVVDEFDEDRGLVYLRPDWSTWIDGGSGSMASPEVGSATGRTASVMPSTTRAARA